MYNCVRSDMYVPVMLYDILGEVIVGLCTTY